MKYICNDIFMLRSPSLPINVCSDFMTFQSEDIDAFIERAQCGDFFDKSLLISTRSLYEAKEKKTQKSRKKEKNKDLSRIKFLIRASTRATPYGLFAGVGLGNFSENVLPDSLLVDEKKAILECRVDHSWLFHLIYELEQNPTVFTQLKLKFNHNCFVSGNRLRNPHYSNHGFLVSDPLLVQRNHIRNTPLITYIKHEAKEFVDYRVLKASIQSQYPDVPAEKITLTLSTLMENEILLSNLRMPSNCADGLAYILQILEPLVEIDAQKETLAKVNALIQEINQEQELEHIDIASLQSIYTLMDSLLDKEKEKDLLALNKGLVLKQNKLPYALKEQVERFVDSLSHLQVEHSSPLAKFKEKFKEAYGSHIEVPLCEIIDPNQFDGLSYLADEEEIHVLESEKDKKIKQIVDEKILYCLQTQGEEVKLYKSDFISLENPKEIELSASLDVNFVVTKEGDDYTLTLAPAAGSPSAGNMFSRFHYVLDEGMLCQYKKWNQSKHCPDPELILVEIKEVNAKGRMSNINNSYSEHPYYISLATNDTQTQAQELTLDDLWIGQQNERFYIKSKSQGKQCKVVHDCMINKKRLSDVAKLLLYLSFDLETNLITRVFSLSQNHYVFTPRICFEDVVISTKNWRFPTNLLDRTTQQSFAASFQSLRQRYRMDDLVYLLEADNRLLLDLNKAYAIDILYKHIQNRPVLQLEALEKNLLNSTFCLDASGRSYVAEMTCSLVSTTDKKQSVLLDKQLDYALQNENRSMMLLQDGWIYAKLYHLDDRENEVLQLLAAYLPQIGNPKFFYLRYQDDSGKHLRVRFKYANESVAQTHFPEIQSMFLRLRAEKCINQVQFDLYVRESNRYGGSELIGFAEEVFFADTLFVIHLLNVLNVDKEADLEEAYLLGICSMLTAFFDDFEGMFAHTNGTLLLKENKQIFRANKQTYIKKVEKLLSRDLSGFSEQTRALIAAREEAIKKYDNKIAETSPLTHSRESIVRSVIHMFCNRLKGGWNMENRYLNIVRESLSNILEKNKRITKQDADI